MHATSMPDIDVLPAVATFVLFCCCVCCDNSSELLFVLRYSGSHLVHSIFVERMLSFEISSQ